ncbi:MAG: hypothetical protein EHM93_03280 [Bacteroidales bacterium]|nr:MAG: hypothetical protein EHM93_03280 [Bacteroidales bacterium]
MSNFKNRFLRLAIVMLSLSIIELAMYFQHDRCLTIRNAGFWLILLAGLCLGVSLSMFRMWIKKDEA